MGNWHRAPAGHVAGQRMRRRTSWDFDDSDGQCGGTTVHLGDDEHPYILGADGEPMRYTRRAPIGFDLTPKRKGDTA